MNGSIADSRNILERLGYPEKHIHSILGELDRLLQEIDFNKIKQRAESSFEARDISGFIYSLKDLMRLLENKGYYRPDFPTRLIMQLVNGLNLADEDIFAVIEKSCIPLKEKRSEQEFLASCAAITQLGYILTSCLVPGIKAASSGPHVFLLVDGFSVDSMIFVDFSIDSIIEVDASKYDRKENNYSLKKTNPGAETIDLLIKYYSSFHVTSGIGLGHNIHNNIGITYDRLCRYDDAVKELQEALRLDPAYIEVHNNLAVTYDKMGKYDEAQEELLEAIRLNPGYTEAHINLGNILAREGRYDEAIGELDIALRLDPGSAIAHNNLGNIFALRQKNEEAIKEFKEALRLNPDYATGHNNLGDIYSGLGMYDEALKEFQEALRLDPEFSEACNGMGFAYYELGSYDKAAQAFVRAVYFAPELLEHVPEKLALKVRQGVLRLKGRY